MSLLIFLLVFATVFGGAWGGVALQRRLPENLRNEPTKDSVQLVMGLIATMAALVLSLLIASTHTQFETQQGEIQTLAKDLVLLNEALSRYGPEAASARQILRDEVMAATRTMSPEEGFGSAGVAPPPGQTQRLFETVQGLQPKTPAQTYDQTKALDLMATIGATRLLIHEQATSGVPGALVVIMVLWLTLLFIGFGLFAPVNATVITAFAAGAFSVAAAIFLILDMSHPYRGLVHVSTAPLRGAFQQIER